MVLPTLAGGFFYLQLFLSANSEVVSKYINGKLAKPRPS
ncbi:hypothetical protein JCM19235_5569 [Vibrio maritimus]|uniref:Uncharacterized protein n=1 Tax=Vibrio maritimus TaxID=990268 RepID=A0A090RNQ5_9VIBR|nr:hypothetical protein JCM19235_5569 [Vibrio maritimus]